MTLSAVIVSEHRVAELRECLESLLGERDHLGEVVLVLNGAGSPAPDPHR
jgi:GT2 family glycosyltransferase